MPLFPKNSSPRVVTPTWGNRTWAPLPHTHARECLRLHRDSDLTLCGHVCWEQARGTPDTRLPTLALLGVHHTDQPKARRSPSPHVVLLVSIKCLLWSWEVSSLLGRP